MTQIVDGFHLPERHLATLCGRLNLGFDTVFAVGTTGLFPYIVGPVMLAHDTSVPTVEINPGTTEIAGIISIKIKAGAAEALDAIWSRYRHKHGLD